MLIKPIITIISLLIIASNYSQAATDTALPDIKNNVLQSTIDNSVSRKHSPEITLDKVQEIFGHNLDTDDTTLQMLLLAIGMDHTTNESPHFDNPIGIPFIVDKGPGYWVSRLYVEDYKLDVLMNNALLLLFTKEDIPGAKEGAADLIAEASNRGYWPATFYVAETNLIKYLSQDFSKITPSTGEMNSTSIKTLAQNTMNKYAQCADMGFAPCQYRIGFWLANSQKSLSDGLNILQHAIKTTINDKRYKGVLDDAILKAAKEIVFKGEQAGLDFDVRKEYTQLIQYQLNALSKKSEANESIK